MEKANGEPSSMLICSTSVEGNALTERHGEDRVLQLQRSASNTERENSKRERGGSSGPDECGRPVNGNGFSSAPVGLYSLSSYRYLQINGCNRVV